MQPIPLVGAPSFHPRAPIWRPANVPAVAPTSKLGQLGPVQGVGTAALLVGTGLSAGVAWAGFYAGSKAKGFLSILGYGVGVLGGLSAVGGLFATIAWIVGTNAVNQAAPNPGYVSLPAMTPPVLPAAPSVTTASF